jgi:hypothetical protein
VARFGSLFATLVLGVLLFAGCSSSKATNTPAGNSPSNTTVAPGATSGRPSTPPCTIPQNNGGDHDSDNNGGPSDGDGCDV